MNEVNINSNRSEKRLKSSRESPTSAAHQPSANCRPSRRLCGRPPHSGWGLREAAAMSEILLRWLNDEVRLSNPVTDFESDFSNWCPTPHTHWSRLAAGPGLCR